MARADAFKLAVEDAALLLEFGSVVGPAPLGGAPPVRVADRILLTPAAAQRLVFSLQEALAPHAEAMRAAQAQAMAPQQAARLVDPMAVTRPGAALRRLVEALDAPFHHEPSFRVSPGALSTDRFLLTLNIRDIAGDAPARCLAIGDQFGMPPTARAAATAGFAEAAQVHFGFEGDPGDNPAGDPGAAVCKLYLERAVPAAAAAAAAQAGQPVLRHLAFKWNATTGEAVTSRYLWHPHLPPGAIAARLDRLFDGGDGRPLQLAQAALFLLAPLIAPARMQYLEVVEPGTARRSFDLNFYGSGLLVRDAQHLLAAMRDLFGLRPGAFQALLDAVRMQPLGHIAGGVHRDGRSFFNIYHGATRVLPR